MSSCNGLSARPGSATTCGGAPCACCWRIMTHLSHLQWLLLHSDEACQTEQIWTHVQQALLHLQRRAWACKGVAARVNKKHIKMPQLQVQVLRGLTAKCHLQLQDPSHLIGMLVPQPLTKNEFENELEHRCQAHSQLDIKPVTIILVVPRPPMSKWLQDCRLGL